MTRDFVVPADPAQRPVRRRATVRLFVLDGEGRVLLLQDSDPGTGDRWWITPGGGIEDGERPREAAARELLEETGLAVAPDAFEGPLAERRVLHGYSDQVVDQHDTFFAVRTEAFTPDDSGHTEEEQHTLHGFRWWTRAEIETGDEQVWPVLTGAILDVLAEKERWPLALPDVEESSVPVSGHPHVS